MLLYRPVHQALPAIQINRVSTFQGEVYIARIGPIVRNSVHIIEMSAFKGVCKAGFHCISHYSEEQRMPYCPH